MGVGAGSTLESAADVAAMTDASPEDFGKRGKNASLPSQAAPYGAMRDGG